MPEWKDDNAKYRHYERELAEIALIFRSADKEFESFEMREKSFLNITGKVLGKIYALMLRYKNSKDEVRKIDVFREMLRILECIERSER